jgi:hypothetical protein
MNLDGIAVIAFTPIVLLISFGVGALVRGILIQDKYKVSFGSILGNIIIGLIAITLTHFAFK